ARRPRQPGRRPGTGQPGAGRRDRTLHASGLTRVCLTRVDMLFTLLAFAIALGVLITFHEYGHYWVARRCGVHVERFSVGFGKVLVRRTDRHGTEWALSAIPLGGYVKFRDDPSPTDTPARGREAFSQQPLRNRAAIVAAGPVA